MVVKPLLPSLRSTGMPMFRPRSASGLPSLSLAMPGASAISGAMARVMALWPSWSAPLETTMARPGSPALSIGLAHAGAQGQHGQHHADGGGQADHDHHGLPEALRQAFEVQGGDDEDLAQHGHVSVPTSAVAMSICFSRSAGRAELASATSAAQSAGPDEHHRRHGREWAGPGPAAESAA